MTLKNYTIGLVLSLALTAASFGAVWLHYYNHHVWPTHHELYVWIIVLALVQLVVQLVCFLHVTGRARSDKVVFAFAGLLVAVLVGGSLWIMTSLNARMQMPGQDQMMQYMQTQNDAM